MQKFNFAWLLMGTLATTQCSRGPDALDEANGAPAAHGAKAPAEPAATAPPGAPALSDAPAAVQVSVDGMPILGNPAALVTVVVFTDYECPYCAKADKTISTLRSELGDDVRVALAMRPLPMHVRATAAARALLAAAEQGKAEAMHARLFADRGALSEEGLAASASAVGLDLRAFDKARTSPATDASLSRMDKLASSLGADGTPTFFVNGRRLMGARSYDQFRVLIDEERARAKELVARGAPREQVYATLMASAPSYVAPVVAPEADSVVDVSVVDAPVRGALQAPVTIALFSDFECPYCVKVEATLRTLEAAYPGKVKIAFRHKPLPMHDHARLAAKASLAADAQGKFWAYHDALVAHRDALDRASLEGYAGTLGLDVRRFARDLDDPRLEARVHADEMQAAKLHVEGTPTTFVNGRRITGAQPIAVFRAAVERELAGR